MSDKITLIVRFHVEDSARQEFNTKLEEVFSHIVKEPTFIDASFLQDMLDPQNLVVHEEWFESSDSFMRNQMTKPYRAAYEKMVVDRKIERTPAWYSTILEWKKA